MSRTRGWGGEGRLSGGVYDYWKATQNAFHVLLIVSSGSTAPETAHETAPSLRYSRAWLTLVTASHSASMDSMSKLFVGSSRKSTCDRGAGGCWG